ncbi:MAG: hypothetical protein ACKVP4_08730 [Hyphomicrobium sp.]
MEISDIALRFVGAFYAFAGFVATRAAIMAAFLDSAISQISMKQTPLRERSQTWWLLGAAVAIFAGGVALIVQLDVARWLFVASALGQALYLAVLAPYYFDVVDPPDAKGRKGTINAFALYLAATAFVLWAGHQGKLTPLAEADRPALAVAGAALAAFLYYLASTAWKSLRPSKTASGGEAEPYEHNGPIPFDVSAVHQVKVMADYGCEPLWSLDDNYWNFPASKLGVSDDLARDLGDWAARYGLSLNEDDPQNSHWSDAQFRAHRDEGRTLAVRLKRERPYLQIFVLEPGTGVVEVHADGAA